MNTDLMYERGEHSATLDPSAAKLEPGFIIQGRYEIKGVLGLGGFAVVYDAEHVGLARRVAIKVLHLTADTPLALLERFRREARISALVRHPNVLEVYDTGSLPDGSPYLVMERVNGQNLSHLLERGPLSIATAVEVVRQLLTGLRALAEADIVHRDIKPDNMMLHDAGDGKTVVKLVDFGISKRTVSLEPQNKLTYQGTLVGTPQYMSPEQIRGEEIDERSDIYAAGAVLYEALAGKAPHESSSFSELVVAVLNEPLRPLLELRANCPPELSRIVTRALSRSREERYASASEMLAELLACVEEHELPIGSDAFRSEDPVDPRWMTPARSSFPTLHGLLTRGFTGVSRPVQLAAGVLLLAAPATALHLLRGEARVAPALGGPAIHALAAGNPVPREEALPLGRDVPARAAAGKSANAGMLSLSPLAPLARLERDLAPLPGYSRPIGALAQPQPARADKPRARSPEIVEAFVRENLRASPQQQPKVGAAKPASAPVAQARSEEPAARAKEPKVEAPDPARQARWEAEMGAALANMVRGELAAAKARYEVASRLQPSQPAAFRGLGLACARLGQHDSARAALQRYLQLSPSAKDAPAIQARLASLPQ